MSLVKKRIYTFVITLALVFSVFFGSGSFIGIFASASSLSNNPAYKYYYSQLETNTMAKNFYNAFEKLFLNGEFKKGKLEYDLIANNVVTQAQVDAYVNGTDDNKFVKAYGMGRDTFYMDHPDLFYADVFSTSISAGSKSGKNVAYLDSSRVLTLYKGSLNTESAITSAIASYNAKISEVVTEANKKATVTEKIEYVNSYISSNNTYGFGTKVEGDRNVDTDKAGYIHTSYGALVNNESVCEGYAKSFKAVMDRLGIPCVCVQGYADGSGNGNYEPHMWNYVEVDGMWYMVDVTYNATTGRNDWLLVGENQSYNTHIEDRVVSSSGYELKYPALKPYKYNSDLDDNGMTIIGYYKQLNDIKYLEIVISYNGKGAEILQKEGKHLAFRLGNIKQGESSVTWDKWHSIYAFNEAVKESGQWDGDFFPSTDYDTTIRYSITDMAEYIQFTVINKEPDSEGQYKITGTTNVSYDDANLIVADDFTTGNCLTPSSPYHNNTYNTYFPSPGAVGFYPANTGSLPVDQTYDIKVVYTEDLELKEDYTENDIKLNIESSHGNDTIKENAKIENLKWDGNRTITFTFTPSKMYVHNMASCYFTLEGLVGKNSKKDTDPFSYSFKGKSVVCSKVFNDGRLYMNVFGSPKMLDNSDLSVTSFKDENGKYYAESQRSQLMLVATKPSREKQQEMQDHLEQDMNVKAEDIVASSTYEIDLHICGFVKKIPNGSYMQVAFGFPEGYSKDDAGTTFKIYHYTHDNSGNITGVEEIPVIVTEYGLIAKVTSFSPFTIVQLKNTSSAVQNNNVKSVYAYVNGEIGGTITTDGKSGIAEVSSDSITYDINANSGYTVGCVRLNGKVLDSSKYSNGILTLKKGEIENSNMLEVVFVSQGFKDSYSQKGVTLSFGATLSPTTSPANNGTSNTVVISLILGLVVIAGFGVTAYVMLKKKQNSAKSK